MVLSIIVRTYCKILLWSDFKEVYFVNISCSGLQCVNDSQCASSMPATGWIHSGRAALETAGTCVGCNDSTAVCSALMPSFWGCAQNWNVKPCVPTQVDTIFKNVPQQKTAHYGGALWLASVAFDHVGNSYGTEQMTVYLVHVFPSSSAGLLWEQYI